MKNRKVDTIIIGAGASGLFFGTLSTSDYLIIDNNPKVGSKMLISGGGKCNITNGKVKPKNYLGNQKFVRNIIKRFDQHKLLSWLSEQGITLEMRKNNQYFCKTSAKDIVDRLKSGIDSKRLKLNTKVNSVEKKDDLFEIDTTSGYFYAKNLVVASGGLSFPKLGATSIGYDIATSFGHSINRLSAGLVGFTVQPEQFFFKELSGISTEVKIRVGEKEIEGALLFAHKGLSGPAVLDASLYWDKGKIEIDFLPDLNLSTIKNSKKKISNLLGIPSRLSKSFLVELEIEDRASNQLTSSEWKRIESLKTYIFSPAGTFGYSKAEVTKGGVDTDEIDGSNMMSRRVKNLYFMGEVLDVTGELGGYNFQWAFSSAFVCADAIK